MPFGWFGRSEKAARLAALDQWPMPVLLADARLTITYINQSLRSFLKDAEAALRKDNPQFTVETVIGSHLDLFLKGQTANLPALAKPLVTSIAIGPSTVDLTIAPIATGMRVSGFSITWADAAMRQINIDYAAQLDAFSRGQAIIAFSPDGIIRSANENFLKTMGYTLDELVGRHHSLFVGPAEAETAHYQDFWKALRIGQFQSGDFKRFGKGGRTIWIHGAYNPIRDETGAVVKVVKFCSDITPRMESVRRIGDALNALARGVLNQQLDNPLAPELDQLRIDLNSALAALQRTMGQVGQNALSVRHTTEEIRSSTNDLSRRTEQQAASLEETAAALDELTATVRKAAEGARHARAVVSGAKVDAEKSGGVVREAVKSMDGIEASSNKISQIIGVIDEIAFQTNLLALNAGVEAARAGDAGRGFAVVAQEVRALAQRSADAAKEIKALISTSTQQVSVGVNFVGQTGQALDRIIAQVTEIDTAVSEIAASAQEQSITLGEINTAVNQMDRTTQQNAAMVEQATAACHGLANDAGELSALIDAFTVTGEAEPAGASVTRLHDPAALRSRISA